MSEATTVHRSMVEAAMARNFPALRALYHEEYVYEGPDGIGRAGIDAAVEVVDTFTTAFPDYAVSIEKQYDAGDGVSIMEFHATGTHRSVFEGIEPTNRPIDYRGVNVVEVRAAKIVREREYYDNLTIMQQLGVVDG